MTTHKQVITLAKECFYCYEDAKGRPEYSANEYALERFYAIAFDAGRVAEREHWACGDIESLRQQLASHDAEVAELKKDAKRYRWLISNSFDRCGVTQLHIWVHEWHPHSVSGESVEWKSRIRGPSIDRVIDEALAATEQKP